MGVVAFNCGAKPFKRHGGASDSHRGDGRAWVIVDANGPDYFPQRSAGNNRLQAFRKKPLASDIYDVGQSFQHDLALGIIQ